MEAKAQRRALAAASEAKDNLKENQGPAHNRDETWREFEFFQFSSSGQQGGRGRRNYNPERRYAHDHRRGQTGPRSENAYRCQGRPRGGTDSGRSQHQSWERRDNYSRNYSNRQMIYREVQSKALAAGSRRRGSSGPQREKNHESTISPAQIGTSVRGAPLRKENTDLTNHQTPNDAALPQEAVEEAIGELREVMTQYTICADPSESAARRERLKLAEEHGEIEQTAINMVRASLATQQENPPTEENVEPNERVLVRQRLGPPPSVKQRLGPLPMEMASDLPNAAPIVKRKPGRPPGPRRVAGSPKGIAGASAKKRRVQQTKPACRRRLQTSKDGVSPNKKGVQSRPGPSKP